MVDDHDDDDALLWQSLLHLTACARPTRTATAAQVRDSPIFVALLALHKGFACVCVNDCENQTGTRTALRLTCLDRAMEAAVAAQAETTTMEANAAVSRVEMAASWLLLSIPTLIVIVFVGTSRAGDALCTYLGTRVATSLGQAASK